MSNEIKEIADRYLAQWNEPEEATRSALIRGLWAQDGVQVLVDPPEEIREAATNLDFPIPSLEVRGHDAMERRTTRAYEMFIEPGHSFALDGEPTVLMPGVVALRWSMVTSAGEVVGRGLDVLALDADGRIRTDHQFIGTV
jgi:hypothetical protein